MKKIYIQLDTHSEIKEAVKQVNTIVIIAANESTPGLIKIPSNQYIH